MEQWANVATYQLRALQQILLGAFGGPEYLSSNLAIVDPSGTGHLIAGCGDRPVLTVRACGGVALRVEGDLVVTGEVRSQVEPKAVDPAKRETAPEGGPRAES